MPQPTAVDYADVSRIANQLFAAGDENPGQAAIRKVLKAERGTDGRVGSPNTIQKHLVYWRDSELVKLSESRYPTLQQDLHAVVTRHEDAMALQRRQFKESLDQLKEENRVLTDHGIETDDELLTLRAQNTVITSERDAWKAKYEIQVQLISEFAASMSAAQEQITVQNGLLIKAEERLNASEDRSKGLLELESKNLVIQDRLNEALTREMIGRGIAESALGKLKLRYDDQSQALKLLDMKVIELSKANDELKVRVSAGIAAEATVTELRLQLQNALRRCGQKQPAPRPSSLAARREKVRMRWPS